MSNKKLVSSINADVSDAYFVVRIIYYYYPNPEFQPNITEGYVIE